MADQCGPTDSRTGGAPATSGPRANQPYCSGSDTVGNCNPPHQATYSGSSGPNYDEDHEAGGLPRYQSAGEDCNCCLVSRMNQLGQQWSSDGAQFVGPPRSWSSSSSASPSPSWSSAHIVRPPTANLTDGRQSLSSGADLNCRQPIRSATHKDTGDSPRGGQTDEHHEPLERGGGGGGGGGGKQEGAGKGAEPTIIPKGDGASVGLFKRAASSRPLAHLASSLVTQLKADKTTTCSSLLGAQASLAEAARGSIKSEQLHDRNNCTTATTATTTTSTISSNNPQRRLGRTIKSLVVSGGSNWWRSRFVVSSSARSKPINVSDQHRHDHGQADQLSRATNETVREISIKLDQRQDADQAGSDAVLVVSSSPLSCSPGSDPSRQRINSILPNSLSCEIHCLCPQGRSTAKLVEQISSDKDIISVVPRRSPKPLRGRKRRRSLFAQLGAEPPASGVLKSAGSNMSAGRQGTNLAKNKYIVEDNKATRNARLQRRTDEINSSQSFNVDKRRSIVCSSAGDMVQDDYDSCDFSSSTVANNNNNSNLGRESGGTNSTSPSNRLRNSNDCNNPSQDQSRAAVPAASSLVTGRSSGERHSGGSVGGGGGGGNSSKVSKPEVSGMKTRENWSMNIEFLLAVIGFAVDLGNIWRFPYICYRNGGGAFLIPYTIMFILGGLPIFYLEMSLGQYFSSGCLTVWRRVCPMAKGIGYAMCVLNFFTGLYYNTIISWAVFFFVESFTTTLPWTSCNNSWNSDDCKTIDQRQAIKSSSSSSSSVIYNSSQASNFNDSTTYSSPTKDYFEREVLQVHLSSGIDDLGSIRRPLAIYLAIVFVCIYFAIWKGVKSTGKAVWITALLPYFVLIPLLIRGVFLEGAWLGIRYYLEPQWIKIFDINVWVEAAKQIYFSLGPGFGTLMALSSYNKFHHNCRRDAFIAASVNYFASFIAGLVVFALLGYMATIMDVNISDVATEGPGLVFQVYPEGLATMRFSAMWSVLFFIMVITLGIDSTFGGLESVITGLCDEYPRVLRAHRGTFIGFLIVLIYFCSLPTTTYGGNYVIYLLESYGTSLSLIFIVLVETIVVCWVYGADRFCSNLEEMYGERPGPFWRICWKYISPSILLLIFLAACLQELDKYHILNNGDYVYPSWAPTLGLLMTGSSVCCIPVYAVYYIKTKTSGSLWQRLKIASRPEDDPNGLQKDIYGDAMIDKISDENDIHLKVVI